MKDDNYKIRDQYAVHFVTFSVVEWINVFTRRAYADIIILSFLHCINNKRIKTPRLVHNEYHIHLIVATANENLPDTLRNFKKFCLITQCFK